MENISINGNEGKMLTIKDIERIIENTEEEIEIAKKDILVITDAISEKNVIIREMKMELQKATTGHERRYRENFWIVDIDFQAAAVNDTGDQLDNTLFENGNYMNKENAERMAKATKLNFLLDRFSRENGWEDKLWDNDNLYKWSIHRDLELNEIALEYTIFSKQQGTVYFTSKEICQQAIEKFRDLLEEVL